MESLLISNFASCKDEILQVGSQDQLTVTVPPAGGGIELDLDQYNQEMWVDEQFLVADIYHECHDVLVIICKFIQLDGKYIEVHFGILPNVRTKLCLPLKALSGEKLFLDRYPGVLQAVLRGDSSIDRRRINQFVIETIPSTTERKFEIANIFLSEEEPEFHYSGQPYIDELGQLKEKEWKGKTISVEELKANLHQEWSDSQANKVNSEVLSQYGGWKKLKFTETGFFRTEFDGDNWWFVDPEGYATFSLGLDCIRPSSSMKVEGMEHLISWLPEKDGVYKDAWEGDYFDYSIANLIRVFGEEWHEKWIELNTARLREWKMNTIGNWSEEAFIQLSKVPYVYPMEGFPTTEAKIYRDFPDVFASEYEKNASCFSKQLEPLKEDQLLIGYFLRNEPHWAFVDGLNLTEEMLLQPHPYESKKKFIQDLMCKYDSVHQLNLAWDTEYTDFADLLNPANIILTNTIACQKDFAQFNRLLIQRYVEIPATLCKKVDPNHLNLGMRYAWVANDDLLAGCEHFDVFSINSYQMKPDTEHIDWINQKLNMPVMIGEFHFGAADVGMLAYGIRAVASQYERGLAYRYYVENAATIPSLIGVHYFQLNDQPTLGRFDGENYQIGIIDVCHQPYKGFIEQMKLAHERIYEIRVGELEALQEPPDEIPKTGF